MRKTRTSSHNPQYNGTIEGYNNTTIDIPCKIVNDEFNDWALRQDNTLLDTRTFTFVSKI